MYSNHYFKNDNGSKDLFAAIVCGFVLAIILTVIIVQVHKQEAACESKGGVLIRGASGLVCVKFVRKEDSAV